MSRQLSAGHVGEARAARRWQRRDGLLGDQVSGEWVGELYPAGWTQRGPVSRGLHWSTFQLKMISVCGTVGLGGV